MHVGRVALTAIMVLVVFSVAQAQGTADATFLNIQGREVGWAKLTQTPHGVLIEGHVTDLRTGAHGFHIHEQGQCNVADGFNSAGGHFSPHGRSHGFASEAGPHAGDMPNQFVQADGTLHFEVFNPWVTLGPREASLLDADGSAPIIHVNADDYRSDPSGNAGARAACAVIEKP